MDKGTDGDIYLNDIGQGFRFRAGIFDAAISVSVLQWLFVAAKKDHNPFKRLQKFFQSLYTCLAAGARAVKNSEYKLKLTCFSSRSSNFTLMALNN